MATEFRLKSSRTVFPLVIDGDDEDGNPVVKYEKKYFIDVGNKEKLKQIYSSIRELSGKAEKVAEDETVFDSIEELSKGIIQTTLGDWENIWEASGHNIYAVMGLVFALAKIIREESTDAFKRYGL